MKGSLTLAAAITASLLPISAEATPVPRRLNVRLGASDVCC